MKKSNQKPSQDTQDNSDYGIAYDGSLYSAKNGDFEYHSLCIHAETEEEQIFLKELWEQRESRWEEILELLRKFQA
jgi:hypothetical protein